VGAYGGPADIMNHVLPAGRVFQAGTLSGNPLATAAGIATLRILRDTNPYDRLESLSAQLAAGLSRAATAAAIPHTIGRCNSMLTLFFCRVRLDAPYEDGPILDWDTASQCDTKRFAKYFWGLLDRGVYMPCSQFEALFVSTAHTPEDIDTSVSAAADALRRVRLDAP
jgi:glutamate-1-semialdehyde 2,1-aminomutase